MGFFQKVKKDAPREMSIHESVYALLLKHEAAHRRVSSITRHLSSGEVSEEEHFELEQALEFAIVRTREIREEYERCKELARQHEVQQLIKQSWEM